MKELQPPVQTPDLLPEAQFLSAIEALPLVSVDWVLSNRAGEILVGHRLNAPARDTWFTPGGRVRKGETLRQARTRIAVSELGIEATQAGQWIDRSEPMGAWDHLFPDSTMDANLPTHYVNLPFWLPLTDGELEFLRLPVGEQHREWAWVSASRQPEGMADAMELHAYVQPYAEWVYRRIHRRQQEHGLV